jgi:hypothetical protein
LQWGNDAGSLPALQLAGADLQDAQHVLTAIAGHSSMPRERPGNLSGSESLDPKEFHME